MRWTNNKPKKDGFYLRRENKNEFPRLVPVKMQNSEPMWFGGNYVTSFNDGGEWLGPVCPLSGQKVTP